MAETVINSPRSRRPRSSKAVPRRRVPAKRPATKAASKSAVTEAEIKAKLDEIHHRHPSTIVPEVEPMIARSRRTLIISVVVIMAMVIGGWLWSLQYSLRLPQPTAEQQAQAQQWRALKQELQASFSSITDNLAAAKEQPVLDQSQIKLDAGVVEDVEEKLVADQVVDWVSYRNFDGGVTVKYPPDWIQTASKDAAMLTLSSDKQTITITTIPKATRPIVAADQTEVFFIGNIPGTLYRETTVDGLRLTVVASLTDLNYDLVAVGTGANLDEQIFTLLTKTITVAPFEPVAE